MKTIQQQAAAWFIRMRDAAPDDPLRGPFEAWLCANPAHAAAYAAQLSLWDRLESGAGISALTAAYQKRLGAARRRFIKRSAVILFLAAGGGGTAYQRWRNAPLWRADLASGIGQVSRQTLADGSTLVLGGDSALEAVFSRDERKVRLDRGEVIFDVASDGTRPFVIAAGPATVTVLGTRFVVARTADDIRVSVERGRVELSSGPFWRRRRLVLEAGDVAGVEVTEDRGEMLHRVAQPAGDAFAFERGRIVFYRASLPEIARTLSRYRAKPVRVAPGSGQAPPIAAVAEIANLDGFLAALPKIFPVIVTEEPGQTVLSTRR